MRRPRYGFRLFKASLHAGTANKKSAWVSEDFDYVKTMRKLCKRARYVEEAHGDEAQPPFRLDFGLRDVSDRLFLEPLPEPLDEGMVLGRLVDVKRQGADRLLVEFSLGEVGRFDRAIGPERDLTINRLAASRTYRALLVPGHAAGDGVLAVEVIDRYGPVASLQALLGILSRLDAGEAESAPWWWIKCRQMSDEQYLDQLLKTSDATMTLSRAARDGSGDKHKKDLTLKATITQNRVPRLRKWLLGDGNEEVERAKRIQAGIPAMLEIIGESDTLDDAGFDDGYVSLTDGANTTRVRPGESMTDLFTYRISQQRPSRPDWLAAVEERLSLLRPDLD